VAGRLARAAVDAAGSEMLPELTDGIWGAVAEAHRLIDLAAAARRAVLAGQVDAAHQAERARAVAYYADAVAAIERRLASAPADRRPVLAERLRGTREEEARRLAEIAEKYAGAHAIRPYRVHVIAVPALRIPVDVRRGDRRYPMTFDWLLPAGTFAPVRCPSCGGEAPMVAGKQKLGCETCLPPRAAEPAAGPAAGPAARAAGAPKAAPPKSAPAQQPAPPPATAPVRKPPVPPVPPKARQREKPRPPGQLAADLWSAVARGLSGNAGPLLEPGSPAAVLYRVFGAPGLTQVLGMGPDVPPYGYTAGEFQTGSGANLVSGVLTGTDESQHRYFLSPRSGLVVDLCACPVVYSCEMWNMYWR
jgi:hypothetical protein